MITDFIRNTDDNFDNAVKSANHSWLSSFGNSYEPEECPGEWICLLRSSENGSVVTAFILSNIDEDGSILLSCLGTHTDYQRQGFGSRALEDAKTFARSNGAQTLRLNVDFGEDEDSVLNFYKTRGFVIESENDYFGEYSMSFAL